MLLKKLSLQNFRNFKKRSFEFSPRVTVVVGPNTSGKTNILEAIYMLVSGKSFRAEVEKEVINYDEEISRVKAVITDERVATLRILKKTESTELEIILTTGQVAGKKAPKKRFLVNKVEKKMADFVGNFWAVLFRPEDLLIVTDSPSLRRDYLDDVLSSVDREYGRACLVYGKGLRQRNKVLEKIRDEGASFSGLEYWDRLLIKNGKLIGEKREGFINFINQQFNKPEKRPRPEFIKFPEGIFEGFRIFYKENEISEERLREKRKKEIRLGMTVVGPHRDDFVVKLKTQSSNVKATSQMSKVEESRDISIYGSRGEQRLAMFWLKLGELAFLEEKTGQKPVLLLDDIFSELDEKHRDLVSQIIPYQQTIITTTDEEVVKGKFLKEAEVIKLKV